MLEFSLKKVRYINIVIIVLIIISFLTIIRFLVDMSFSEKKVYTSFTRENESGKRITGKNLMEYAAVLQKNPFGKPMQLQPIGATEEKGAEIRETASISDLKLVGTVVGPPYLSYAVFEDTTGSGKQEVFHYGDEVYNYGTLHKIERSSVELKKNESTLSLQIDYEKSNGQPQRSPVTRRATRTNSSRRSFAKQIGEREYLLDRNMVQKSIENPEKVLTDARLLPNIIDGKQEGFRISEVVPDGIYHSLGLRNGDILLNINGLEISNPEVAIQAMSALRGMDRIALDIMRDGTNMSIDYRMR